MKNRKLKLVLAVVGLAVFSHAADIDWAGVTGQWADGTNWVGGVVPDTSNADSAFISSGTSIYDAWVLGDLWVNPGNKIVLDGGSFEQNSTHYIRFVSGGVFEISNGGSLSATANKIIMAGGGTNTVDGPASSITALGNDRVAIEGGSALSLTGGATADFSGLWTTLWDNARLNISDNSVGNLKNIFIEGASGAESRVNLSDSARLNLLGTDDKVISVMPGGFVNFDTNYTGYVNISGIEQATLETMIVDGKFGIGGASVTNPSSYAVTTNINVVNIGLVTPPVPDPYVAGIWLGGDGDWFDTSKWSSGVIPDTLGVDNVVISSTSNILVTYVPGDDYVYRYGSDLLLDGSTLYQDSTAWSAFKDGSTLTIANGGAFLFEQSHLLILGLGTGEAIHTVDNGTLAVRELEVDDHQIVILTNGATASVSVYADIVNGSRFEVMDATLSLGEVALYTGTTTNFVGTNSFINVNDGALVNLDAGFYAEGFKTNVIKKTGDSMINFSSTNSSGEVFIDNISLTDVEALISQSKLGIGGTINTTVADYIILAAGAGQRIRVTPGTMPIGPISGEYASGDFIISWDSFSGQGYEVQEKTDLTLPTWGTVTNVVGLGGVMSVAVPADQPEAFYQIISE